jgi:hypothetical protein
VSPPFDDLFDSLAESLADSLLDSLLDGFVDSCVGGFVDCFYAAWGTLMRPPGRGRWWGSMCAGGMK